MLVARTEDKNGSPRAAAVIARPMAMQTAAASTPYANPYVIAREEATRGAMQTRAREEAERIMRTGDISSFEKQLAENQTALKLMGYGY